VIFPSLTLFDEKKNSVMKHQKHAKLNRPRWGQYGRNEWAILGTPCGEIKSLAADLTHRLASSWSLAYIDADHKASELPDIHPIAQGGQAVYTDKINYHQLEFQGTYDSYDYRRLFNEKDLVLVNGNHFKAERQIVVIDPRKEESLSRKIDRLTQVDLLLFANEMNSVPEFLQTHLPEWRELPRFSLQDRSGISEWLKSEMETAIPPVYGLLLAGGESRRMGKDKGLLNYHGKPQREWGYELLAAHTEQTFLSVRPDQSMEGNTSMELLPDTFLGLGPFGGILSAFRAYPNAAWLVAAVDLPFLDHQALEHLLQHRNPAKVATAFQSPVNEFPDPLLAIWEPKSYLRLFQFLTQGYSCPRKVLINSDIELLQAPKSEWLVNVNEPQEYEAIKDKLS
jgi:molybdopterin-guanine dinucleotide biosynthesis protein A